MSGGHLLRGSTGHLLRHANGHLRLTLPAWHTLSTTLISYGGYSSNNDNIFTRETINRAPTNEWAAARNAAISAFSAGGSSGGFVIGAWVGGAYNAPGAPRATCCLYGKVNYATPASICTDARIACSQTAAVGVFTSQPSGAQLLAATEYTPSGGYISLSPFLSIINECATNAVACYVSVTRNQPASPSYDLYDYSYTNTSGTSQDFYGLTQAPGETIYWKNGGTVTLPSFQPSITSLQLYY